jgi:aminoglycoside phosphotransferase (APT) family kinase protein
MPSDSIDLPEDIMTWMADAAGGTVTEARQVPGGASNEAWFVDIERPDGSVLELFLRYGRRAKSEGTAFHSKKVEAEIFMALADTDVVVPRIIAVHDVQDALLSERISGQTWFYLIRDPDEQVAVAQDFIANLAALHRLDPRDLELPSFGAVRTAREHTLEEIAKMRARATGKTGYIDPIVRMSLDWLEANVPDYDGPVVLVQGDTGPGNFMYENGKVTAVVDWELAHLGDPMDDIAWLSLRTVQDTFTHFPDRMREYEELSGHKIDEQRVWYYRLLAEIRLSAERPGEEPTEPVDSGEDSGPIGYDVGNGLIYSMLHRRLTLEALGAVMGLDEPASDLPDPEPVQEWHALYDIALGNMRAIVPRIEDPLANRWTRGLVRLVKNLKEIDRSGRAFLSAELDDITTLLGHRPDTITEARRQVAAANQQGDMSDADYVTYQWRRVQRDGYLNRTSSGALGRRTWPELH